MGYQSYGGHSDRETPGPIPNPEVKSASADGTAPERWWEGRTPPNILSNRGPPRGGLCCVGGPDWLPRQPPTSQRRSREGDHPWPTSDATRVPPVDPEGPGAAGGTRRRAPPGRGSGSSSGGGRAQQRSTSSSGGSRGSAPRSGDKRAGDKRDSDKTR